MGSTARDSIPFWNPATYKVSIVAIYTCYSNDYESILDEATWVQAWDIRDAFAATKYKQPLNILTVMKEVGFPTITLNDVERWANFDGTFGPSTKTYNASELSVDETLYQLKRYAITALARSNPGRLAKVLLAAEA
ncbi:hypothetical protein F5Y16DRAFT_401000 [Xylariaceae sp. FL0255]|nr:hypothetical protein F5Y16DRAFT_401000 [Xylariaceae sp. FL0255]